MFLGNLFVDLIFGFMFMIVFLCIFQMPLESFDFDAVWSSFLTFNVECAVYALTLCYSKFLCKSNKIGPKTLCVHLSPSKYFYNGGSHIEIRHCLVIQMSVTRKGSCAAILQKFYYKFDFCCFDPSFHLFWI